MKLKSKDTSNFASKNSSQCIQSLTTLTPLPSALRQTWKTCFVVFVRVCLTLRQIVLLVKVCSVPAAFSSSCRTRRCSVPDHRTLHTRLLTRKSRNRLGSRLEKLLTTAHAPTAARKSLTMTLSSTDKSVLVSELHV